MADVSLVLCLIMQMVLLQSQHQVGNKCVLQLVVVVQHLQFLIQVISYAAKVSCMLMSLLLLMEY